MKAAGRILAVLAAVAVSVVLAVEWVAVSAALQGFFGFRNGTGNGSHYLFWSGSGSDLAYLSFLVAGVSLYRKNNCKMRWCWRIGHHPFADPRDGVTRMLCWKHHPDVKHPHLTREKVREIQERRHIYLGRRPGKG